MDTAPKNENVVNYFDFDMREAYDSESESTLLVERLKELGLYGPEFLYSGFDEKDISKNYSKTGGERVIFCSKPEDLMMDEFGSRNYDNALDYAIECKNPVIGVYDKSKMLEVHHPEYKIVGESVLVALVRIKT